MRKLIDLTDRDFTRLLVIKRVENNKWGHPQWFCLCDCGNLIVVLGSSLRGGGTQSCGCLYREQARINGQQSRIHGMCRTVIYSIHGGMMQRCYNANCPSYKWYGARGIKVYEPWHDFMTFYKVVGDPPEGKSLDRFPDNNGSYIPGNWRWATPKEQANNRRDRSIGLGKQRWFKGTSVIGREYKSNNQRGFARTFNLSSQQINACLNGRRQTCKGWIFSYLGATP